MADQRRTRAVGMGVTGGMFLTFGMTPPAIAYADIDGWLDSITEAVQGTDEGAGAAEYVGSADVTYPGVPADWIGHEIRSQTSTSGCFLGP